MAEIFVRKNPKFLVSQEVQSAWKMENEGQVSSPSFPGILFALIHEFIVHRIYLDFPSGMELVDTLAILLRI
jgi:hypothetical protein